MQARPIDPCVTSGPDWAIRRGRSDSAAVSVVDTTPLLMISKKSSSPLKITWRDEDGDPASQIVPVDSSSASSLAGVSLAGSSL